jgi:hypothetical protein
MMEPLVQTVVAVKDGKVVTTIGNWNLPDRSHLQDGWLAELIRKHGPGLEFVVVTDVDGDAAEARNLQPGWTWDAELQCGVAGEAELVQSKHARYVEIDRRTDALIAAGFEFPPGSGLIFNLSQESQLRFHGCDYARASLVYPIMWQTLDDNTQIAVEDAAMMHTFFLAAFAALRSIIDSGTALKKQVADATTLAGVNLVADSR